VRGRHYTDKVKPESSTMVDTAGSGAGVGQYSTSAYAVM